MVLPGVPLHVYQRGNNRARCFLQPSDYRWYLRFVAEYSAQFGCAVHAYCLMTNHVHLLLTPSAPDSCALLMKRVGQCYVQTFNKVHARTGTLWEGRFHSCLVPTERYILSCYRYIELNPVRAGMVAAPGDYPWSSYSTNAAAAEDVLVQRHPVLEAFGASYGDLFQEPVDASQLEEIRKATRNGHRLGDPRRPRGRRPEMAEMGTDPISAEMGSVPISKL